MKEPKLIGLLIAWGAEPWIRPAIKQALEYCDEIMVVVAAHNPMLRKFEDNTYNICKEYPSVRLLNYEPIKETHIEAKSEIFNYMLKNSKLYAVGNWIWILDVDEFYPESAVKAIKVVMESNKYDYIRVEEKFFLINMQHYLEGSHGRLIQIGDIKDFFVRGNNWSRKARAVYILPRESGMFHYSMLGNMKMQHTQWGIEYPGTSQSHKMKWASELYPNYDLKNEDYWKEENFKMFGVKSPWFDEGFTPDKDGRLFRYEGRHPKLIEEIGYPEIKDFRRKR